MEMLLVVQRVKKLFSPLHRYCRNSVHCLAVGGGTGVSDWFESDDLPSAALESNADARQSSYVLDAVVAACCSWCWWWRCTTLGDGCEPAFDDCEPAFDDVRLRRDLGKWMKLKSEHSPVP